MSGRERESRKRLKEQRTELETTFPSIGFIKEEEGDVCKPFRIKGKVRLRERHRK